MLSTGIKSLLYYIPRVSPSSSPTVTPPPSISYRSTHASIPTAAQPNATWKTLTPLWSGPVVWATGSWTVAAPVTTKWAPLHIWIKSPGGRVSLNTTQSRSWSWICLTGSVTRTASVCIPSLSAAAWRTWERWRRRRQRSRGIYSRRSPAGWRAPSLVCTRPVPVHLWNPPATPPPRLFLSPRLTFQLQSSTMRRFCDNHQLNLTKTDEACCPLSRLPRIPFPRSSPRLPPLHCLPRHLSLCPPLSPPFSLSKNPNPSPLLPPFLSQPMMALRSHFPSSKKSGCSTWTCSYPELWNCAGRIGRKLTGRRGKREDGGKKASSRTLTERCPGFQSTGLHHHRLPTRDAEFQLPVSPHSLGTSRCS